MLAQDGQLFLVGNPVYFFPKRQILCAHMIQVTLEGKGEEDCGRLQIEQSSQLVAFRHVQEMPSRVEDCRVSLRLNVVSGFKIRHGASFILLGVSRPATLPVKIRRANRVRLCRAWCEYSSISHRGH